MLLGTTNIKNLSYALKYYSRKHPHKIFLITSQKKYTYGEINNLVNNICLLFKSLDIKQGDIISAVLKNDIEYIVLYLASLRFGSVFNPYPYTLESKEVKRYLECINPKFVFCQHKHFDNLKELEKYNVFLVKDIFVKNLNHNVEDWNDFVPDLNSPACIYYSSGTTGNPKNILFSHKNMIENISSIIRGFHFSEDDVHLIILPLGHTASINYSFLPCTLSGASIVIAESFWKIRSQFWSLIKKNNITYIEIVPSILLALLNTPYSEDEFMNVNSLKFIGCGSSTLPKDLQTRFMEKYGIKVANLYGLSETGPTHIDYPLEKGWKPGSIGVPLDVNEVRIIDNDDNEVGIGETGEIVIKGENVFRDYYNNHNLYNNVVKDGFFKTGDLGYKDNNGVYYFSGRKKDLIIKGGVNISPDEIDEILYKIDEIEESLTVGKPDKYLGEEIVSFIVLKNNVSLSESNIRDFCKKYLSHNKIPDKIKFVNKIPKGHSGKNLRKKLRNILK